MNENKDALHAQLNEWQEKLNYFRKEEANIVDLPQKFQANKHIKEAETKIKSLEEKINICNENTQSVDVSNKNDDKTDIKTLHQALDLFIDQKTKLNSRTAKEEIEEIEKIKADLINELFGDYNRKITEIPILKDKTVTNLFERIFSEEKLTKPTIDDISAIRNDKKNYDYYYRSIIVSSLTLSLLNYKTFDVKKLDKLIDFLTDFESGVWKRSLTGIVLTVLVHQNRLERYPDLVNRLKTLQDIEKIQAGVYIIDKILRNKLFENVSFFDGIQNNEFLTSSPYNWFFPFYKDNNILTSALENTEADIDSDEFSKFIHNIPLLSCFKYMLCKSLEKNELSFEKVENKPTELKKEEFYGLDLAYSLQPYYNLVSELFLYYKFFPQQRVKDLFNSKTTIAQTKLKNIILSKVQSLKLLADLHFEKKEYHSCILKLTELLNLEPNQLSALTQISECLEETKQFSEALTYLFQIEKIQPDNVTNLYEIGYCLNRKSQYKKSNEYILRADKLMPDTIMLLNILANNYYNLKEFNESILLNERILIKEPNYISAIYELNRCYSKLNNHDKALEYSLKLFELDNENPDYIIGLASDYSELNDIENSEKLAERAYELKRDDLSVVFSYARILFLNGSFEKSESIFNRLFNLSNSQEYYGITYGNLGHIALFEGDEETAMNYYKKCVLEFDDIKDFEQKFDTDLKYALKRNITEEKYISLKNDLINYWSLNKN